MRMVIQHRRTMWNGFYWQNLTGQHHGVRRLAVHLWHRHILVMLIPRGVRVRTGESGVWREL